MNTPSSLTAEQIREHGRMLDRTLASGERAPHERAGPAPVVAAVATGSSSVSSAAVFEELNQMATDYEDIGQERTADTIRAVAEMYRRHAACTIPRQPSPNVAYQPRPRAIAARVLLDGDALCLANVGMSHAPGAEAKPNKKL